MVSEYTSQPIERCYEKNVVSSPYDDIPIPELTVDQYVWKDIKEWEDRTALECGLTGQRTTYGELRCRSKILAGNLANYGKGTALFVLPNCLEFPIACLGCLEAGLAVSTINPDSKGGELKHQVTNSGAIIIITNPDSLEQVVAAELDVPIICTGDFQKEGVLSFEEMTEKMVYDCSIPPPEERISGVAFLPYSSGTTGLPKGVRLTHRNVVANLTQASHPELSYLQKTTVDRQDTLPSVLPFFHVYGLFLVMLRGLSKGAKLVILPKFDTTSFVSVMRNNKDIVLFAVPPMVNFLGSRPDVTAGDLENLNYTLTGAAPCGYKEMLRLYEKKPHIICQAYGMTEFSAVVTHTQLTNERYDSVGVLVPNTLGCVVDQNSGLRLPPGQHGELCFKGPQVMEGYHNNPEATQQIIDSDGWLHTGDIGYVDTEGNFFIVDRLKELIKVKGYQVAPAELEALLRQHPSVMDVGVTAAPSTKSGELPVAFIVGKPGIELDLESISDWVAKQVAPYKKLAKIIPVSEIPISPSGKILRRKLKEIAKEETNFD